ncbi:MAG: bifunctional uridylyltransferase/uridylyl-removing protein, partial [Novosphingobium sp.]|nr:bifunctional uridylyltransferase/uridylyl-removing protein [Novosphingobium sp.]
MSVLRIPNQRDVIDRRKLTAAIAQVVEDKGAAAGRQQIVDLLRAALRDGRSEIGRRLSERPHAGHDAAIAQAFLIDQIIRIVHDHVVGNLYPVANRSTGERITIMDPHASTLLAATCEQHGIALNPSRGTVRPP